MALHIPDIREIRLFVTPYADFITNGRMTRILTGYFLASPKWNYSISSRDAGVHGGVDFNMLFFGGHLARPLFVDIDRSGMFFWLLLALAVGVFSSSVLNGNYGSGKVGVYQTGGFLNITGRVIFQVAAVFLGFGAAGMAGGLVFGIIVSGIVGLRFLDLRFARFGIHHLKSLFSFSFWIFLAAGGSLVFSYADVVLIGYFMENADIGVYRVAFQFTTAATFTTVAMRTVLYPNTSRWSARLEYNKVESALTKGFTHSLLLAVPVLIGGLLLGDQLLYFCYGAGFARGAPVLYLLLAAQVANVFMYLQTMGLLALDRPKESFKVAAVAATANILLDLALIPMLGITGAAVATLLTMSLNAALAHHVLNRTIDVRLEYPPSAIFWSHQRLWNVRWRLPSGGAAL